MLRPVYGHAHTGGVHRDDRSHIAARVSYRYRNGNQAGNELLAISGIAALPDLLKLALKFYQARNRTGCSGVQFQMRSEENTSELQSLMRISYAVFCLKKNNNIN